MKLYRKLRALFRRRKLDTDMSEEMRLHLELQTEKNIAAGMDPDEARYTAQRQFGGIEQIKERCRDQCGWVWLEQWLQDFRHALRSLRKSPVFTAVAVFSLALGIGANTAVFSLVDRILLTTELPIKNPAELILFQWRAGPQGGAPRAVEPDSGGPTMVFSESTFERFRKEGAPLADLFASAGMWAVNVTADNQSEVVPSAQLVSGDFYRIIGVSASRGRTLSPEDMRPEAPPVAVISDRYWKKRFDGDPEIVGKTVLVNRLLTTIVGVTPPGFLGTMQTGAGEDIVMPLSLAERIRRNPLYVGAPNTWWLRIAGRLKPGVTAEALRARLEGVFQKSAGDDFMNRNDHVVPRLGVLPGGQARTDADRRMNVRILTPLVGMAGLLLLAACANVAALILARGVNRRREIAVRLALGAGRARLIRQLFVESLLVALFGAGCGLLFSRWNLDLLGLLFPRGGDVREWLQHSKIDWHVLGFTTAIAAFTGVLFGLAPALRATKVNLTEEFQGGPRSVGGAMSRIGQSLVSVQVAFCVVLLVSSALFVRTVFNLQQVDLGFDKSRLLLFSVDAFSAGYKTDQFTSIHQSIAERIRALRGVQAVAVSAFPWFSGSDFPTKELSIKNSTLSARDTSSIQMSAAGSVRWNAVSSDFFAAYGMPILNGRCFDALDNARGPRVVIVNQALVREYFGGANPVGQRIVFDGDREIVGVVRDAKQSGFDLRGPTQPMAFFPFSEDIRNHAFYAVRTESEPTTMLKDVRRAVANVNPAIPLFMVSTQAERTEGLFLKERMFAWVAGYIGLITLSLAYVGLYGLISTAVLRRTGEIGVRIALGAMPGAVLRMILRDSLSVVVVGLGVGFATAWMASRLVASMLFGLSPNDSLTYGGVAVFLICVALLACWLPARSAAKVDPVIALRCE